MDMSLDTFLATRAAALKDKTGSQYWQHVAYYFQELISKGEMPDTPNNIVSAIGDNNAAFEQFEERDSSQI
jgi:hypothetical protein